MNAIHPHPKFASVQLIELGAFEDDRGWMSRISDEETFKAAGIPCQWSQVSHSHTARAGVLRGISVSLAPFREAKMVRILRGRMQWVLVDLRADSATFGQWGEVLLDEKRKNAFYAPKGFAHSCLCLSDQTDLLLMADCQFDAAHATGIRWDDPALAIGWRKNEVGELRLSDAHRSYGSFSDYLNKYAPAMLPVLREGATV
jgi:dTDP-4-dehydrorhamnose 3,5-epimerase